MPGASGPGASGPGERRARLEAEQFRIGEQLRRVEVAIGELEGAVTMRADAVARLAKYRQNHERLQHELRTLEWAHQAAVGDTDVDTDVSTEAAVDDGAVGDVVAPSLSDAMLEQARKETKKRDRLRS